MNQTNIKTSISDRDLQNEFVSNVHRFAAEVMRPIGQELDRMQDPADVIAAGSPLWEAFERYRQLDISSLRLPQADWDPVDQAIFNARISEEFGWGDSGLAISFGVANFHKTFAALTEDLELADRYLTENSTEIGCWAITEADHGSDSLAFTQPHWNDGNVRANVIATRDGDDYIINGSKSAWVSNGTIATVATLYCTIDGDKGFAHGGVAVVPLDLPGVSRGKPLDKLGQRALNQGEIHFDQVRIPGRYMVVSPELYTTAVETILTGANASMGCTFVGTARAGYELALDYAKNRTQGGKPITEHQSVQSRMFSMFARVEAARALARQTVALNATEPPGLVQRSIASKTFSTRTAFDVNSDAIQIFGGNGLTREYPIEKIMRDARASMIEDGCNDLLAIIGGQKLFQ